MISRNPALKSDGATAGKITTKKRAASYEFDKK
jgi:hypothetical protein